MRLVKFIDRQCPLCGSEEATLKQKSKSDVEQLSDQEIFEAWRGFRKHNFYFDFYECCDCTLLYCKRYFSDDALTLLYSKMEDNLRGASEVQSENTQRGYVESVSQRQPIKGRWLDVGADVGHSSDHLRLMGSHVDAIEPNRSVWPQLQKRLHGGKVVATISELGDQDVYDGVLLIHVLDHLTNPLQYFRDLSPNLEGDSVVSVVVHNYNSALRRLLRHGWPPFCLQHPQIFSEVTLLRFLKEIGCENAVVDPTTNIFTIGDFLSDGFSAIGFPRISKYARKAQVGNLRIRLGNIQGIGQRLSGKV